ncbi:monovalent cation/H+ antiporter complex subunit F [Nesterenkonia muleiensis]|uniref:monovalent cation/H+ antiporter complex subunit F n=1 Tax=Nesterenkonia muleiensis TaxID=2282648 RepID=UPI000E7090EE|nr:monovalent cation/H+ antiporter complex subunit F [Nesterenkonia muleiensis]
MSMLDYAYWITQVLLAIGVMCSIYRVYKGPSVLDRVISVDVILIIVGSVMLVDMIYHRHTDHILFVVVTAVIGFLGAVAIARYVAVREPGTEEGHRHAQAIGGGRAPEPETPASASGLAAANSGRSAAGQLEDESTSWFADLARSGFVPKRKNDDESTGQGSGGGGRA